MARNNKNKTRTIEIKLADGLDREQRFLHIEKYNFLRYVIQYMYMTKSYTERSLNRKITKRVQKAEHTLRYSQLGDEI